MISKFKTAMIAGVLAVGAVLTTIPVSAEAADNNGHGIVYHRSDCGNPNVRFYGDGGEWSGSTCGRWLDPILLMFVWSQDWNWSACDLARANNYFWRNAGYEFVSGNLNFAPKITWQNINKARDDTPKCGY
jgi:hypothetical protein